MDDQFKATLSTLVMSIASAAAMSLGLAPDPHTGTTHKDKQMAKFNIDLLLMLQDKTKNNTTEEEKRLIQTLVTDLQSNYIKIM